MRLEQRVLASVPATMVNGARDRSWNFTLDGIDTFCEPSTATSR